MWKNIQINKNQIKTETGKATLIAFPKNSEYAGYCFWHPSKLIRDGKHSACVSLGYTDDFKFTAIKYGSGKYNKFEKIDEIEISVEDFENSFGNLKENSETSESYLEVSEPEKLEIGTIEVPEELKK